MKPSLSAYSTQFGLYFCVGTLMWLYREKWAMTRRIWIMLTTLTGALVYLAGQTLLGLLMIIAPLVVTFGEASTPVFRRFGRFGDLSYGVYIYAFIVQQTLAWYFGRALPFGAHLALTTVVTLACAWSSWHLIEKRALSLKDGIPALRRAAVP